MIGDNLLFDILMGNLNKMTTVWLYQVKDYYDIERRKLDAFFTRDKINRIIKEKTTDHPAFKRNI